jgi:hypothetical protein
MFYNRSVINYRMIKSKSKLQKSEKYHYFLLMKNDYIIMPKVRPVVGPRPYLDRLWRHYCPTIEYRWQ